MDRKVIHNFNQVYRDNNSLYVIDIDETILYYKNLNKTWLDNKKNELLKKYKSIEILDRLYQLWEIELHNNYPLATDYYGINNLINYCLNNNSDVILLTARNKRVENITKNHVDQILEYKLPIFFAGGRSKGKILKNIINRYYPYYYKNIYFIDDLEENCVSVEKEIPNIIPYLYKK